VADYKGVDVNETTAPPGVVDLARANGRTVLEVLALHALAGAAEEWLPRATRMVVGPVRPLSYDEAMGTRLGELRVKGADLRVVVDYRRMRIDVDYPKPVDIKVTKDGRADWYALLADDCDIPLCVFPAYGPETYVRRGFTLHVEDFRLIG
jgi:hypothetical protein